MQYARRYDIDWLRVIAIFLLIIYHISIIFQPWGVFIGFIQSPNTNESIFIPMSMLNVWRIPLLFFVSGMGVCFAMQRRNWKQLLADRAKRILLPLIFGSIFIVPIHVYIFQSYYKSPETYSPNVGHLWFLVNIFIYFIQVIGFTFLDKNFNYSFYRFFRKVLEKPFLVYLFVIPFVVEAWLINPEFFSFYVGTGHGFLLGMIAFHLGFQFVAIGNEFWSAVEKTKYVSVIIASVLFFVRWLQFDLSGPGYLTAVESMCWIFSAFGFACRYLNKPSDVLAYLSDSVYPVYILHMIFLYWGASLVLPLNLGVWASLLLIILFTSIGCYTVYELVIKRINIIRPLFGMKWKSLKLKLELEI